MFPTILTSYYWLQYHVDRKFHEDRGIIKMAYVKSAQLAPVWINLSVMLNKLYVFKLSSELRTAE